MDVCDPEDFDFEVPVPAPQSILWGDSCGLSHVLSPAGRLQTEQETFAEEGASQRAGWEA